MNKIGQRIKELRLKRSMTQAELGSLLGVQKAAIQKYESGAVVNLRADKIKKLCSIFKVYPLYFIYENDEDFFLDMFGTVNPILKQADEIILKFLEDNYGFGVLHLLVKVSELNSTGQSKVLDYILDMHKINEYLLDEKGRD